MKRFLNCPNLPPSVATFNTTTDPTERRNRLIGEWTSYGVIMALISGFSVTIYMAPPSPQSSGVAAGTSLHEQHLVLTPASIASLYLQRERAGWVWRVHHCSCSRELFWSPFNSILLFVVQYCAYSIHKEVDKVALLDSRPAEYLPHCWYVLNL